MIARTDLIAEEQERHAETVTGAEVERNQYGDVVCERVKICTQGAATILRRPIGTYYTVQFSAESLPNGKETMQAIVRALTELMPERYTNVLVVGLGNRSITPDAVGPLTADRILATRHIDAETRKKLHPTRLRSVAVLAPGVLGKTGIEAIETVRGTSARIRPDVIIVIDALAARHPERLCRTVQLCDTGICPGSGVQNARKEFSQATLGVPVIAIGVPTVVDVASLVADLTDLPLPESARNMMITPQNIDAAVIHSADMIAHALNLFLQPDLDEKTLLQLV